MPPRGRSTNPLRFPRRLPAAARRDGVLEEILAVDRGLAPDESALARHSSREGAPPSPAEEVVEELLEDLARGIWGVLREPALALASDVGRAADPSGAA